MAAAARFSIQATAGAIPVKNEKGQVSMQKVKVQRYQAGKRPDFAPNDSDSSDDSDRELPFQGTQRAGRTVDEFDDGPSHSRSYEYAQQERRNAELEKDPRWMRIVKAKEEQQESSDEEDDRLARHRQVRSPEIMSRTRRRQRSSSSEDQAQSSDSDQSRERTRRPMPSTKVALAAVASSDESDAEDKEEISDDEIERRRLVMRRNAQMRVKEEELLAKAEEEKSGEESEEESEYSEYSESEEEDAGPRLKPVFVRKRDRVTLQDTEKELQRLKQLELDQKKTVDERKRHSVKIVEHLVKKEIETEKEEKEEKLNLESVQTDDENEELAYEQWKVRELKRIKRDKEEREAMVRDQAEIERVHNMTDEERRQWQRMNPKNVTNKQAKGKYKFLQKYFHRGAFYLDEEDERMKRNFAEATLEDHFDRTVLPKIMQVKNFGLAGRTKYTHLVDQDTSDFNSAWSSDTAQNLKFFAKHAAGVKEVFARPSAKKRKKT